MKITLLIAVCLCCLLLLKAYSAETVTDVQFKGPPAQAARCFTEKAQKQGHATKTKDPEKGEHRVVLYRDKSAKDEASTLVITASGSGSKGSLESDSGKQDVALVKTLGAGC